MGWLRWGEPPRARRHAGRWRLGHPALRADPRDASGRDGGLLILEEASKAKARAPASYAELQGVRRGPSPSFMYEAIAHVQSPSSMTVPATECSSPSKPLSRMPVSGPARSMRSFPAPRVRIADAVEAEGRCSAVFG